MPGGRTTSRDIASDLRAAIADGTYPPGARLPSRSQLTGRYHVASPTVVNAINVLRAEGLIDGVVGSGWYVRTPQPPLPMTRSRLEHRARAADHAGAPDGAERDPAGAGPTRVDVELRVEPARDDVAAALELEPGTEILVRDGVVYADDQPVQLAVSYLPRDLTAGTSLEDTGGELDDLAAALQQTGLNLTHVDETVRIGRAAEQEANRLHLAVGDPVFRIERTAHTATRPIGVDRVTAVARYELAYQLPAGVLASSAARSGPDTPLGE